MLKKVKKGLKLLCFAGFFLVLGFGLTNIYYNRHYVLIERAEAEDAHSEYEQKEAQYMTIDKRDFGQFATLFDAYQELYSDHLTAVKPKELIEGAIAGMVGATGDRYTSYTSINSDEDTIRESLSSRYKGIGAEVSLIDGYAVIVNPYKNAPAYNAGVQPYDRILKVGGEDVVGLDLATVTSKVKGEEGTEVILTLQRGTLDPFDVAIIRSEIVIQSVFTDIFEQNGKKIGRIEIGSFSEETARDFSDALSDLEEEQIEGLVIDVRDNGGGYLDAVQQIAGEFLPIGTTVLKTEDKHGNTKTIRTRNLIKDKKPYPIVVLVNESSASASEVLASAMKESGNYPIIGTTTFGKGTVQELRTLDDKSELKMTIAKWLTPKDNWVHEKGIEPDIHIEAPSIWAIPLLQLDEKEAYKIGDVSEQVRYMQLILMHADYDLPYINGYFDEATEKALKEYQTKQSLEQTGALDHETVFALNQTLFDTKKDTAYDDQLKRAIELVGE